MVPTNVATTAELSKLRLETYRFSLHDNSYMVLVYDESTDAESWEEMVTVDEIREYVELPNGMVDISITNPVTQCTREQYADFDFFMAYEFDTHGKQILMDIICNRYKKEAA